MTEDQQTHWAATNPTDYDNATFLDHLDRHRHALFTFLRDPRVQAANFWAVQAIRPAVVNRKVWGGQPHLARRS